MIGPGWQKARRRRVRQFGVNALAKIWFQSKFLRELKKWYLQRRALASSRTYRPLGDRMIRLLRIRPGHTLNTIECDFLYVNLHSSGNYVALSYTWQQQAPSVPILVNGRMVLVSENLYLALLHLRKRGFTTLWIDAICINQRDLPERASQVHQMKDIYQRASIVVVWLGDANNSSTQAFDALHGILEHLDWQGKVPSWIVDPDRVTQNTKEWRAISEILYRPWFRRMWVIQEVLAARRAFILCGKDALSMDFFLMIVDSMLFAEALRPIMSFHPNRHELSKGPMKVAIKQLEFLVKAKCKEIDPMPSYNFRRTLLSFLADTRWAEATDPRDKVYGILSLAEDAGLLGYWDAKSEWIPFRVDYRLSKEQVFISVTKAILHATESLDVLRFARKGTDGGNGLPSWVPNWANEEPYPVPDYTPIVSVHKSTRESWRADREGSDTAIPWCPIREQITLSCSPSFTLGSSDALIIRGIHYDTITAVSKHAWPNIEDLYSIDLHSGNHEAEDKVLEMMEHQLELLHEWVDDCTQKATKCSPYPTGESTSDALWRTLNVDAAGVTLGPHHCDGNLGNIRDARSTLAFVKEKCLFMRSNATDPLSEIVLEVAGSHIKELFSRFRKMATVCTSKRFATTRKKYMGLVPQEARVGDLLCVMYGCETPFTLRRSRSRAFKFLGHSSVHGLDFDSVVAESSFRKRQPWLEKPCDFSTVDASRRIIYTTLKRTRNFTLV